MESDSAEVVATSDDEMLDQKVEAGQLDDVPVQVPTEDEAASVAIAVGGANLKNILNFFTTR